MNLSKLQARAAAPPARPGALRKLARQIWQGRNGYLFILPPFISICLFFVYPFSQALWYSLHDYNGREAIWVGLDNYTKLMNDEVFQTSVLNTIEFGWKSLALGVGVALFSALVMHHIPRGKPFFRAAFFLPMVTNMVAVSFLWQLMYNRSGLINDMLGIANIAPKAWLQDPKTAMNAIVVTSVWQGFGYSLILFLAALDAIPNELNEAATVDGANPLQWFWYIILPELRYVLLFLSITGVAGAAQAFTQVQLMTGGGPMDTTRTVMFDLYRRFTGLRLGEANAVGILIFIALVLFALINMKLVVKDNE